MAESDHPPRRTGEWTVCDFAFHTGDILPELRLAWLTIGDPSGAPFGVQWVVNYDPARRGGFSCKARPASCALLRRRATRRGLGEPNVR